MPDKAHRQTDKMLDEMEHKIRSIYAEAEKDMRQKWDEYMKSAEKRTGTAEKALSDARKGNDPTEIKAAEKALRELKQSITFKDKYFRDMVAELSANYTNARKTADAYVNGRLPDVYALNYNAAGSSIEGSVKGYSFSMVDRQTVKDLMAKDKSLLPPLEVDGRRSDRWNTKIINSQVMQGILQGEPIPKIAERLQNVTEMTASSAVRNARTATTMAENRGRYDANNAAADDGIELEKKWLATTDSRTRETHAAVNGETIPNDEYFTVGDSEMLYPGDPDGAPEEVYNCRCTLVTRVVGFRKLR